MRKSIVVDEKDIEIIAGARARSPNKWLKRASVLGFALIVIGGLLEVSGKIYGFGIMGAGAVILGITVKFNSKSFSKAKKQFIDDVNKNGELPPWPEDPSQ